MNVITVRTQIRAVAARWRAQYSRGSYANDPEKQDIAAKLEALDAETATADDVELIIGNTSWVQMPKCHECGKLHHIVVEVGEPVDYESSTAQLCLGCLMKAAWLAANTTV